MAQIIPTAEPFLFLGDAAKPACLLIHGFTGTPKEMRSLGEYLNGNGHTCLGVRLTGHATTPGDMIRSRHVDWIASVEDGYHQLRGFAENIVLVGLSMGGALSLLMSTRLKVRAVAAFSTPYEMPHDYPAWFLRGSSRVKKFSSKSKGAPGSGWFDKTAYQDHVSYPENPVRSAAELKELLLAMRAALPKVTVPVLLIHSKDDTYVPPGNLEKVYTGLVNARDKTKLYITGSGHVITRDAARHQVFETVEKFIERIGGRG